MVHFCAFSGIVVEAAVSEVEVMERREEEVKGRRRRVMNRGVWKAIVRRRRVMRRRLRRGDRMMA